MDPKKFEALVERFPQVPIEQVRKALQDAGGVRIRAHNLLKQQTGASAPSDEPFARHELPCPARFYVSLPFTLVLLWPRAFFLEHALLSPNSVPHAPPTQALDR